MKALRTPDERFLNLPGYPFDPNYYDKPFLTAFSDSDPVTSGGGRIFQKQVPGADGQPHATINGGHFLQEDCGEKLAGVVVNFMQETDSDT